MTATSLTTDDNSLIERLKNRDPAAFETLVRNSTGRMLAVARRFFRNESDAHDAVQDAFLQAYKALPRYEARSSLATWLHSITVRACLMRLRHQRSHPETQIDDLLPTFVPDGHRADVGPAWRSGDAQAIKGEERALVRQSIEKLPEDYRNVLLLRDIEEMDTRQTADLLGVTEGVIKTRLHRARQALRTLLDPYFRNNK